MKILAFKHQKNWRFKRQNLFMKLTPGCEKSNLEENGALNVIKIVLKIILWFALVIFYITLNSNYDKIFVLNI